MWTRRLACIALACACLGAAAEPRVAGMDSELERWLARGDYLFVWDIDRGTVGRGDPYRTMRTYFDALMYAVTEGRRLIEPGTPATLRLDPLPAIKGWDEAYAGRLESRETYLDDDPVTLHAEIVRRDCGNKRAQVFFALSVKPRTDSDWKEMRAARDRIRCAT